MPLVRISLNAGLPADTQRAIADGVHQAMVDAIGIPAGDRFQIIDQLPAGALIADPDYLGVARQDPVFVQITLVRGRSPELKAALFAAIAKNVSATGVRPEDVHVCLTENSRDDWSMGNGAQQLLDEGLLTKFGWKPPTT